MKGFVPLIRGVSFDARLADKAFDADGLLQKHDQCGATAVIPPKANGKIQSDDDAEAANGGIWWRMTSQRSKRSEGSPQDTTERIAAIQNGLQLCSLLELRSGAHSIKMNALGP